jgi:hypothetical protein
MIVLKTENMMHSKCYKTRQAIMKSKKKSHHGDTDFNVKSFPIKKGKNHERKPAKLHYIRSVYKYRGLSNDAINPRIYIGGSDEAQASQRRISLRLLKVDFYSVEFE